MTADYGCIYNPKGTNTYGNLIIYLVPKQQINLKDDEIEIQTKSINNLTINDYKNEFTIFIYLIDARYLNYNPKGEPMARICPKTDSAELHSVPTKSVKTQTGMETPEFKKLFFLVFSKRPKEALENTIEKKIF